MLYSFLSLFSGFLFISLNILNVVNLNYESNNYSNCLCLQLFPPVFIHGILLPCMFYGFSLGCLIALQLHLEDILGMN